MDKKQLEKLVEEMSQKMAALEDELAKAKAAKTVTVTVVAKTGKKDIALGILVRERKISNPKVAAEMKITPTNVSSVMSYLRDDGWLIGKTPAGWHVLLGWDADAIRHPRGSDKRKLAETNGPIKWAEIKARWDAEDAPPEAVSE